MSRCINKSHIEVKNLSKELNLHPEIVAAQIALWQDKNNTDEFPTKEQLEVKEKLPIFPKIENTTSTSSIRQGIVNHIETRLGRTDLNITKEQDLKDIYQIHQEMSPYRIFTIIGDKAYLDPEPALIERYIPKLPNPYSDIQFSKNTIPLAPEELSVAEKKIELLKRAFPDVKIELDNQLQAAGALLGNADKLAKGYKETDKVIAINPNLVQADTAIHEFGHLYIDLLGGTNNPRIRTGIEELRDSELWKMVQEKYPELSPDQLEKEVLATAIGTKGAEIYGKGRLGRILDWILTQIQKLLGIDKNVARQLASEMLNNTLDKLSGSLDVETQYMKIPPIRRVQRLKKLADKISRLPDNSGYKVQVTKDGVVSEKIVTDTMTKLIQEKQLKDGISWDDIRISEAIKRGISPEDLKKEWEEQAEIGGRLHDIIEAHIGQNMDSDKLFNLNRDLFANKEVFDNFLKQSKSYFSDLNLDTENTLHELKVYDPINNVASTIDIIKIKADGTAKIVDIKTKKVSEEDLKKPTSKYDRTKDYDHSDMDKVTVQTMGYSNIVYNMDGVEVDDHGLIPIEYTRDAHGKIDNIVYKPYVDFASTNKFKDNFKVAEELVPRNTGIPESTITEKELEDLNKLKTDLIATLTAKKDFLGKKHKEKLDILLSKLHNATEQEYILTFLRYVNNDIKNIQTWIERAAKGEVRMDSHFLINTANTLEAYSILDDIAALNIENFVIDDNGNWEYADDDVLVKGNIRDIQTSRTRLLKTVNDLILDEATDQIKNFVPLAEFVSQIEKDFSYPTTSKDYESKRQAFIRKELENRSIELEKFRTNKAKNYLLNLPRDISSLTRLLIAGRLSGNTMIEYVTRQLDIADMNTQMHLLDVQKTLFPIVQRYTKDKGALSYLNTNSYYDDLISKDSNGKKTEYLISKYKAEFEILRREAIQKTKETGDKKFISDFYKENTEYVNGVSVIKDKWLDTDYQKLNSNQKEMLEKLYELTEAADDNYDNRLSNVKKSHRGKDGTETKFYKLPAIHKSLMDRVLSNINGNIVSNAKEGIKDIFSIRPDDTEFAKVRQNIMGQDLKSVPIYFRTPIGDTRKEQLTNQSYNIIDIIFMDYSQSKNYAEKRKVEDNIALLQKAITAKKPSGADASRTVRTSWSGKPLKNQYDQVATVDSTATNWYKKMQGTIDDRLYGIHKEDDPTGGYLNKFIDNLNSITAKLGLFFNVTGGTVNYIMGETSSYLETVGNNGNFSSENLRNANKEYGADFKNIIDDIGRPVKKSKTNLLGEQLNILSNSLIPDLDFNKTNKIENLMSMHNGNFMNEMGEHKIRGTMMYAILDKYKVQNAQGEYLDKDGNVTTQDKAATLPDVYERKMTVKRNGETMEIDPKDLLNTDTVVKEPHLVPKFNNIHLEGLGEYIDGSGKLNLATNTVLQDRIIKAIIPAQGNYNQKDRTELKRKWYGSALMLFREWMAPAYMRRFEGITVALKNREDISEGTLRYDDENFRYVEGYYSTTARFLYNALKDVKNIQATWNTMTPYEKGNAKKFLVEMTLSLGFMLAASAVAGMAKGAGSDDKEKLYMLASILARSHSELNSYINVMQLLKILQSPSADISTITDISQLMFNLIPYKVDWDTFDGEWGWEEYKTGRRKGQYKWRKQFDELIPIYKQIQRNYQDSYKWLSN